MGHKLLVSSTDARKCWCSGRKFHWTLSVSECVWGEYTIPIPWNFFLQSVFFPKDKNVDFLLWTIIGLLFYHSYPKVAGSNWAWIIYQSNEFFSIGWRHWGGQHKGWASHYNKVEIIVLAIFLPVIGQFYQILCSHWLKWSTQSRFRFGGTGTSGQGVEQHFYPSSLKFNLNIATPEGYFQVKIILSH